ncbi:SAF domain-containing protein [Actinophytocola sp. NPDC049390]|uniref:SAF domain-containing protein n=1 Tax=Actinophytocola sp. NPDC049390 TaxID=3363894 RepID=UPI0037983D88
MTATPVRSLLGGTSAEAPSRFRNRSRRSMPHLVVGALLVTSCTAGGIWWSHFAGEREPALVVARPLTLGAVLEPGDLREVRVALDGPVDAVPAAEVSRVVGQRVAVSLPAGVLLPRGALGTPTGPGEGRAVAALALGPGQAAPDLVAGAAVLVVLTTGITPTPGDLGSAPGSAWPGLVTSVTATAGAGEATRVVAVDLDEDDARQVAATPTGRLSLVIVPGGER